MKARNRVGRFVGLKDLGTLSGVADGKPASAYRPGERVGIFTVFENAEDEALIGDKDKHLDVVLSIHREKRRPGQVVITVTTIVHVKNLLGRIYMVPVKPMHRLIAPAVLAAIGHCARGITGQSRPKRSRAAQQIVPADRLPLSSPTTGRFGSRLCENVANE